jgi:DNA primase
MSQKNSRVVKKLLDSLGVDAFLKTSGKTGLHILMPLKPKYTYDQVKQFAQISRTKYSKNCRKRPVL